MFRYPLLSFALWFCISTEIKLVWGFLSILLLPSNCQLCNRDLTFLGKIKLLIFLNLHYFFLRINFFRFNKLLCHSPISFSGSTPILAFYQAHLIISSLLIQFQNNLLWHSHNISPIQINKCVQSNKHTPTNKY